jgi:curved DNA-binding protein CbpA
METLEKNLKELNNENLYKILHIEKNKDPEIVKRAYKKMIKKYHPDKNKEKNTVEIFEKIRKAYEILQNVELKALYDSYLDRKDEKAKRIKIFSEKRKSFADDLKRREEENQSEILFRKTYKDEEPKGNKFTSFQREHKNSPPKLVIKTFEDKLHTSGVKIKWSKDSNFIFTKETIYSYFKEYGTIEEINFDEEKCKAYILFLSNKSVNTLLNTWRENPTLSKLFRIRKCSKKSILDKDPLSNLKSSFLDSNTINTLKNMRMMKNVDFMNADKQKKEDVNDRSTFTNTNKVRDSLSADISLEDFEKAAFANLKMKFQNKKE